MPTISYKSEISELFNQIRLANINKVYRLTRKRILEYAINEYNRNGAFRNKVDECIQKLKSDDTKINKTKNKVVMMVSDELKKAIAEIKLKNKASENDVIFCLLSALLSQ